MRSFRTVAQLALLALALTACTTVTPAAAPVAPPAFPMTVESCGEPITLYAQPERVLTVGSVAAPILAAAGASDHIILRTFETAPFVGEYSPALSAVPIVQPAKQELSREDVIAHDPDLVISFQGAANSAADLSATGIPLLVNRGYCADAKGDFEDVFADIEQFGKLLGTEQAANQEVQRLRARLATISEQTKSGSSGARRAAALIFARDGGSLSAYGATSTVDKQMDLLGLTNVFGDVEKRNFQATTEDLIGRDPEVIILLTQGDQTPQAVRDLLAARPEFAGITAVRNAAVVVLPFGYTAPSPVAVEGLEVLARELTAIGARQ